MMRIEWINKPDKLHLSIQYFKQSETSDGETGCSSNYIVSLDKGYNHAYNECVTAAKRDFHLPELKLLEV